MSTWNEINFDEIEIEDGDINIYAGFNDFGNIYVTCSIKDLLAWIKSQNFEE